MKKTGAELQKVEQQNCKIQMPERNKKSITGKWNRRKVQDMWKGRRK